MKQRHVVLFLLLVAVLAFMAEKYWPRAITETSLASQLAGAHCRFVYDIDHCEQRGIDPLRSLFVEQHDCDIWAVKCLESFKSPQAIEIFIQVLSTKTDIETCDGSRPIRSLAVRYLGNSGDRSAVEPLRQHLSRNPTSRLSSGASGCEPRPEDIDGIKTAIEKLERE
jgi:hypothetical protein